MLIMSSAGKQIFGLRKLRISVEMLFGPVALELFNDSMIRSISSVSALCIRKFESALSDRYFFIVGVYRVDVFVQFLSYRRKERIKTLSNFFRVRFIVVVDYHR